MLLLWWLWSPALRVPPPPLRVPQARRGPPACGCLTLAHCAPSHRSRGAPRGARTLQLQLSHVLGGRRRQARLAFSHVRSQARADGEAEPAPPNPHPAPPLPQTGNHAGTDSGTWRRIPRPAASGRRSGGEGTAAGRPDQQQCAVRQRGGQQQQQRGGGRQRGRPGQQFRGVLHHDEARQQVMLIASTQPGCARWGIAAGSGRADGCLVACGGCPASRPSTPLRPSFSACVDGLASHIVRRAQWGGRQQAVRGLAGPPHALARGGRAAQRTLHA